MSRRTDQIASTLQRAVQEVIRRGFQDPRIRGLITVTKVEPAPDLKTANVFVSVFPEEHEQLTMHGLRSAEAHVKHEVGDLVALRRTPQLRFRLDESLKKQADVFDALAKVRAEREERGEPEPELAPDPADSHTTNTDPEE